MNDRTRHTADLCRGKNAAEPVRRHDDDQRSPSRTAMVRRRRKPVLVETVVMGWAYSHAPCAGQGTLQFRSALAECPRATISRDMRPVPTAQRLIRVAFAAVFGVMSLAHGPVMAAVHDIALTPAVARGPAPAMHHGEHHHAMGHVMPAPEQPEAPASGTCNSFACFLAVGSLVASAPAASLISIGQLAGQPVSIGSPAVPEPAEPPPRLQA